MRYKADGLLQGFGHYGNGRCTGAAKHRAEHKHTCTGTALLQFGQEGCQLLFGLGGALLVLDVVAGSLNDAVIHQHRAKVRLRAVAVVEVKALHGVVVKKEVGQVAVIIFHLTLQALRSTDFGIGAATCF